MLEQVLTVFMLHKGVDPVSIGATEDNHQPHMPEKLNTTQNRSTPSTCVSILSKLIIKKMPHPLSLFCQIAGAVIEEAEVTNQRVKMPTGVADVHQCLALLVGTSTPRPPRQSYCLFGVKK